MVNKTNPRKHNWLRISIITFSSLAGVVIAGVVVLVTLVNPNDYKSFITAKVQQQLGAQLQLESLRWELFPHIGIKINNLTLTSPTPLGSAPLVQLADGEISLQLLPLLHGKFNVDQIVLKNANISLLQNQTQNNWTFNRNFSAPNSDTASTSNQVIQLSKVKLENINVTYQNLATQSTTTIKNFNLLLQLGHSGIMRYSTADGNLILNNINYEVNQQLKGILDINYANGDYSGDIKTERFALPTLLNSLNLPSAGLIAKPWQNFAVAGQFSVRSNSLQVNNAIINLGDSTIQFTLNADSLAPLHASNQMQIDKLEASDFAYLKGYHLRLKNTTLQGNIATNQTTNTLQINEKLNIENMTLYGYDLHSLSLQIGSILSNPLKIIAIPVTISQIRSSISAADSNEHKNLSMASNLGRLNANLNYSAPQLRFSQLTLSGPDVHASGNGVLNNNNSYLSARINAQFVAAPNSLTGKIVYPVSINGNQTTIDWSSVSTQLSKNLGSSLIDTGKQVGGTTGSVAKNIGNKIKSWF